MPFTSETILKFGENPVSFAVVTLLSYSMQNEKMGAFDYRRKEVISLEGLFEQVGVAISVPKHFLDVKTLLSSASADFVNLTVNGKSYGEARFISFNFPTSVNFDENAIRHSKFTIQLEIIKEDDDSTFANANLPTSLQTLNTSNDLWQWYKLKDFSEDFSFKLGEDGNFEASHSISFQYDPGAVISDASLTIAATDIANGFFKQALKDLSSIDSLYSSADFQSSVSDYGSSLTEQSVDLINYKFAYSKNYTVFSQNNGVLTSETITTEVIYKDDGSIEVSEKGRIKGKGASYTTARSNAITKLNANLLDAYTRCNASFGRIKDVVPKYSASNTLQSNPVSITKDLTDVTPEVGYEIKFTTNPAYLSTSIHTYSINLKKDDTGICEATQSGSIKFLTNKKKSHSYLTDANGIINAQGLGLITPYYANYAGIKTTLTINSARFGAEFSYSKVYSNALTLIASGVVRQLIYSESSELPVNKFSTVKLVGSPTNRGKEIIYQTRQLSGGTKNITIEIKINRKQLYAAASASNSNLPGIFTAMKHLFSNIALGSGGYLSAASILPIFSKIYKELNSAAPQDLTYFLEDSKLSIDNNYTLKADLVFKFFINKEQL